VKQEPRASETIKKLVANKLNKQVHVMGRVLLTPFP